MLDIDPLSVCCNKCKAKKNKPCVYIWPKDAYGLPQVRHSWTSPGAQAKMDRAGTPTKRPHMERVTKARWKYQKEAREAEERLRKAEHGPRDEVLRANADALKQEQSDLRAWLDKHVHILVHADRALLCYADFDGDCEEFKCDPGVICRKPVKGERGYGNLEG